MSIVTCDFLKIHLKKTVALINLIAENLKYIYMYCEKYLIH